MTTQSLLKLAAGIALIPALGTSLRAEIFYWNNTGGDQSVNNVANYSTDQAGTTGASALPSTNDVVYLYSDICSGQIWLSNPWELAGIQVFNDGNPWPWINGDGLTPVILSGTNIGGIDNCVIHVSNGGGSIPGGPVVLNGGGAKVVYSDSGDTYEIYKGVGETNGSASLIMDGTPAGRVLIESGINITGELIITNGTLTTDYSNNPNPPSTNLSSVVVRIWGPSVGGSGRFSLEQTNLTYYVKGLIVDQPAGLTNYPPGSYTAGTGLGYDRFETAGDGNSATIVVLPSASASNPVITSISVVAGTVTLAGTNGAPGQSYTVKSSGTLTTPIASWTTAGSGTFGGSGQFSVGVPASGSVRFYRLSVP